MESIDALLERWRAAGLLDDPAVAGIRAYEAAQARPRGRQWQVLLALTLGGILLGAGVLLFVAAHWDAVSPLSRLALVLSMLIFFHGLGLLVRERFNGFATAMHALGTVSAGAAIALVGQIFNMQEHWPAAILLWALCAGAGWLLLRDAFQQTLTLLLVPAWIVAEFDFRVEPYDGAGVYLWRIGFVIAAIYLSAFLAARSRALFGILFGVAALLIPSCAGMLADGWSDYHFGTSWGFIPLPWRLTAVAITLAAFVAAWFQDKRSLVPASMALVLGWALPWLRVTIPADGEPYHYPHSEPSVFAYALVALAAVGLVVWGVHLAAKSLVNYGVAAFACTVFWFYFADVMDKLGRSLGLIALGALFLGGGWLLERTRRSLMHTIEVQP